MLQAIRGLLGRACWLREASETLVCLLTSVLETTGKSFKRREENLLLGQGLSLYSIQHNTIQKLQPMRSQVVLLMGSLI